MKTRFAVIGYGWRADFFYRIAKALPERFEICAGVLRTEERAKQVAQEHGVFATSVLQEALEKNPDFVVLCVPRAIVKDYLVELMKANVPVLCETPPAKSVAELEKLWLEKEKYQGRIEVLEQYHLQPFYQSLIGVVEKGLIGKTSTMMLSTVHGYHATSLFRKFLKLQWENCEIKGQKFGSAIVDTNGRAGFTYEGNEVSNERELITLQFDNGKVAIYDFSFQQYFSTIRGKRIQVQGVKGEIENDKVRYLDDKNRVVIQELVRRDLGICDAEVGWHHFGMQMGEHFLYENPVAPARLNDDEIAIADCLIRMKHYVDTGESFYALEEALQDTYLSFMMEQAITEGTTLQTETQVWARR